MEMNLKGKTALVTGASYGLGFACAKALAQEGVRVAICSRNQSHLDSAAQEILDETGQVVFTYKADLTSEHDVFQLVKGANADMGTIDILVLSTGHPPAYSFSDATDKQWDIGNDLILKPAIKLTRALLPDMRKNKYGRLIYVGSIFGLEPESSSIIQSTYRTGINAFSKCIAEEAAIDGVTANVLCPGYFETPLLADLAGTLANESKEDSVESLLEDWKAISPAKKFGKPDDFGAFVSFLASPRGEFINGTSIALDGGSLKQY
jgi:3-oxoacyl-[acyl-carrier protein] reductase